MSLLRSLALAGLIAATPGMALAGSVTVTFVQPERYADGNLAWSPTDQRLTFEGLERILRRLAEQRLAAGYRLDIEVVDLNLAGKIDPLRSRTGQMRVMREDTWPSMRVRYTLRQGASVIRRGQETIIDMNYLMDPVAARSVEPLRFEKAMLGEWFRTRFAAYGPAAS